MATFFYRGNALWVRGTVDKVRYQLSCSQKTTDYGFKNWYKRANPDKVLEELLKEFDQKKSESSSFVGKFDLEKFGMFIIDATKINRGEETQKDYERLFTKRIVPFFADPKNKREYLLKDISKIASLDCVALLNHLKTQLSDDRVKRCRNILTDVLDYAVEYKHLEVNPFNNKKIKRLVSFDTTPKSNKTYSTDEVKNLLENSIGWFGLFLHILFTTGMRVGEAKGIKWADIDFETGQLNAKRSISHNVIQEGDTATKKHIRTIQLFPYVFEKVKAHREIRLSDTWVFANGKGDFLGENHVLLNQLKQLCKEIGIEYKALKPSRRSYASILYYSGIDKKKIQENIGHAIGSNVTDKHYLDRRVLEVSQEQKIAFKHEEIFLAMIKE
jgi:integrase